MRIEIATLFPEMCEAVLGESIVGRARRAEKIQIHCRLMRLFFPITHTLLVAIIVTKDKENSVDV